MKEAIEHYEAALKAAFPEGASGEVFNHWNEARKALAQPQDDCDGCGEVCRRSQLCYGCDRELEEANARLGQPQGEHKTDGTPCWCNPEVTYENPETGAKVIVHREPQGEDTQCLIYVADVDMPEGFRDHMERIAELEQDPQSKAALDRARDRFAGGGKVIEWVDLTDYEIGVAFTGSPCLIPHQNQINGLRAVIAKFKEKNTPPVMPQGEPVAWIDKGRLEGIKEGWQPVLSFKQLEDDVPLYTTLPSSQLADAAVEAATSDEEMTKFANGYLAGYEDAKENAAKLIDNEEIHRGKWFAAAIRSMK